MLSSIEATTELSKELSIGTTPVAQEISEILAISTVNIEGNNTGEEGIVPELNRFDKDPTMNEVTDS